MKRSNLCLLFCAALATALLLTACAATPAEKVSEPPQAELSATLEAPPHVPNDGTVPLKFTLTNNSDHDLYVLKWYTPLEGIFGEIFRVTRDGQPVPYEGPLVMRGDPLPEDYVLLKAGGSASAEVDLATAYDFSQAGEYSIEFLSPRISHVARSQAELAQTVDDLGPVQIPANRITLRLAGSSDLGARRTPAEAADMVRRVLQSQKPALAPDFPLAVEELPLPDVWRQLQAQGFRVTEGPFVNESFLIRGHSLLSIGQATGGQGLTSVKVADLDADGRAELLFTYSFGSGIHQSRIGMWAPAYDEGRVLEADVGYLGDLGLLKEGPSSVKVRVVEPDDAALTLRYLDTLGYLAIERHNDRAELVLRLDEDLPDEVRQKVMGLDD